MTKPSPAEIGQLQTLNLLRYYRANRASFVRQGRSLVAAVRGSTKRLNPSGASNIPYTITQDELENILNDYLNSEDWWHNTLQGKWNLPYIQHATITDTMSRYIAADAFNEIIS